MPNIFSYIGSVIAIFLSTLAALFSGLAVTAPHPVSPIAPVASSTTFTAPAATIPAIAVPPLAPKATVATTSPTRPTSTPPKVALPVEKPAPLPVSVPVATLAPAPVPASLPFSGNTPLDTAAATLRGALVNIICYAPAGGVLHSISGSGIFIDPKGIILTNAHVAQYFLLADRGVSCTIRSGSPAVAEYKAALIYISPAWVHANASVITQPEPIGTGEYDFAFLAVTKSTTAEALPASFPSLPLAQLPPAIGTPVVIASYGAQFLATNQVQADLFPTIVFGSIKDVFTFAVNTIDVLALGGSAAAQEGSSGGGIADSSGSLVGTITTSTNQGTTDSRSLDAITASYIRSEYLHEMGMPLDALLSEPTEAAVTDFAPQMPMLESLITANLP